MQQSRSATGTRRQGRTCEAARRRDSPLALALLHRRGVVFGSFYQLTKVDLGFRVDRVLTFDAGLPSVPFDAAPARRCSSLARRLAGVPGASAAGGTVSSPATGLQPVAVARRYRPAGRNEGAMATGSATAARSAASSSRRSRYRCWRAGRRRRAMTRAPMRAVMSADLADRVPDAIRRASSASASPCWAADTRENVGVIGDVMINLSGKPRPPTSTHRRSASNRNWALTANCATNDPPSAFSRPSTPSSRQSIPTWSCSARRRWRKSSAAARARERIPLVADGRVGRRGVAPLAPISACSACSRGSASARRGQCDGARRNCSGSSRWCCAPPIVTKWYGFMGPVRCPGSLDTRCNHSLVPGHS